MLERFKYRIDDKTIIDNTTYNAHVKSIVNPRQVDLFVNPHFCNYFFNLYNIDERGKIVAGVFNGEIPDNKIIINHYYTKSREEYIKKSSRGRAELLVNTYKMDAFEQMENAVTIYDDDILKYVAERKKVYVELIETKADIDKRRLNALLNLLLPASLFANGSINLSKMAPADVFTNKAHIFLTCWKVIKDLNMFNETDKKYFEELSLKCIHNAFLSRNDNVWQILIFLTELHEIIKLDYPVVKDLKNVSRQLIPQIMNICRMNNNWFVYDKLNYILKLL